MSGKISYEDFCLNKSQLLADMNTGGQTSSSDSNSAPEFLTDTECNINMRSCAGGGGGDKAKKENIKDSKADKHGKFV